MERQATDTKAPWALSTGAVHSFQPNRHAGSAKPRSVHAETKKNDARITSQMTRGNNAREVAATAAKRWISDFSPLNFPKTKRQLSRPLDLPSLSSPGTPLVGNTNHQQQRHAQSKTNRRRSRSNVNNISPSADNMPSGSDPRRSQTDVNNTSQSADKRPDNLDSIAQRTALQCVSHASMRQAAAKAAMTATALISNTLGDLVGDSNRALAVARQSQMEAEKAAARAEGGLAARIRRSRASTCFALLGKRNGGLAERLLSRTARKGKA